MNPVFAMVRAFVRIVPGTRVRYFPPPYGGGEDYNSDRFFETHYGKKGTVVAFEESLVGPFDFFGRLPGVYADPDMIKVVFDGEQEEYRLKYIHLAVIGNYEVMAENEALQRSYKLRDLPHPIDFYEGDYVSKKSDPVKTAYQVKEVTFDGDSRQVLTLKDTDELAKRAAGKSQPQLFFGGAVMPTFKLPAVDAVLAIAGPVRLLYENRMDESRFESPREAMEFWTEQGVSKVVYPSNRHARYMTWRSLEDARASVAKGEGHFFVEDMNYADFVGEPKERRFHVYRLHPQFAMHASRAAKAATELLSAEKLLAE